MIITLFGGSRPDKETYKLAYELGKRIALKGYILKNGGNSGVMEASAKGCSENNGKVIGVVLENPKVPSLKLENPHSSEIIKFKNYQDRVKELLKTDRIIVLPGQIGTIEEFLIAWIEAITNHLKPIIVMGKKNKELLDFLISKNFVKEDEHLPYITYVDKIEEIDFLK